MTGSWSGARRAFPKKIAARVLRRDKHCQLGYDGCTELATEVDHVIGVADGLAQGMAMEDLDDISNAAGVCKPCHQQKTRAEQARGRQRAQQKRSKQRSKPKHPGLL